MDCQTLKTLKSLQAYVNRFGTLYHTVSIQKPLGSFIGHSPRPKKSTAYPKKPTSKSSPVTFSPPKPELSLAQVAHLCARPEYDVYPDLRSYGCSRTMFGRSPHSLLYQRKQPKQNACIEPAELKELNRLARLVELTPRVPYVPIYARTPRVSESNTSATHMVYAALTGFTCPKNPSRRLPFEKVFPSTKRPQIALFSGQPRIPLDTFNALLASKLSCLRSKLGLNSTPKNAPTLVSSWINMLLSDMSHPTKTKASRKPATVRKGKNTTDPSEQNGKKNTVAFTPAAPIAPVKEEPLSEVQASPQCIPVTVIPCEVHPTYQEYDLQVPQFDIRTFSDRIYDVRDILTQHSSLFTQARLARLHTYTPDILHPLLNQLTAVIATCLLLLYPTGFNNGTFRLSPDLTRIALMFTPDSSTNADLQTVDHLLEMISTLRSSLTFI
jgi:hypothetical protein